MSSRNSVFHQHIAKGSMKSAHNTDDRSERATYGNAHSEKPAYKPYKLKSNLEDIRKALRERDSASTTNS